MGRKERATTDEERDITNALIKALNPAKKKVYFLAGHGERDINGPADEQGLNAITDALKRDNYEFDTLVLAQTNAIPADATVIVVAGPAHRPARTRAAAARGVSRQGRASCWCCSIRPTISRPANRRRAWSALLAEVGHQGHRTSIVT